jgi:hypothetical protein
MEVGACMNGGRRSVVALSLFSSPDFFVLHLSCKPTTVAFVSTICMPCSVESVEETHFVSRYSMVCDFILHAYPT